MQRGRKDPLAGEAITSPSGQLPLATLPRSEQFDLKSEAGLTYTIKVGFPHVVDPRLKLEIKNRKPTAVYIVDGQSFFGLATDLTRFMQWGGDVPPCLIVTIQRPTDDPDAIDKASRPRKNSVPRPARPIQTPRSLLNLAGAALPASSPSSLKLSSH